MDSRLSNSSSSTHHSNSKKRKKNATANNTNQKTLGVAWGSKSLSASSCSSRKSPFSDFSSYMAHKNCKLQNQFDSEASASAARKPIFSGVSIFVDGFTVPSSQELRGYMLKYDGRFENYFSRHCVTHIICSNLPDSKVKNIRAFSAGLPVVKPTWILDSIAANRLLSWVPYQLEQVASNQPKLSAFFTLKSSKMSEDTFTNALCQVEPDVQDSFPRVGQLKERHPSEVGEMVEVCRQISNESNDISSKKTDVFMMEEPIGERVICDEEKLAEANSSETNNERNTEGELDPTYQEPSTSFSIPCSDNQNVHQFPSSEATGSSKQCHSTLTDPNFVENYFKNSRLHFIGTWRQRYRKRFPTLSTGLNNGISNSNKSDIKSVILHVDMDCFFVSVVIRNKPALFDKPVAVCHSNNSKGTSEISSANYPARSYGIRAGMFVRDAKALCPHLVTFPYNFEAYEEVADQFYSILHRHCNKVQAVSCDEAFLDFTDAMVEDPELLASSIRKEIYETTRCTASAGIGGNMLMARIATRTAKPNGQCYITPERVDDHLNQLPVDALPGIGYVLQEKLKKQSVNTCGQLRMISKNSLQKEYGMKTGEMLWNYSRGIDYRSVGIIQECKSIGADVNWGVRFRDMKDCEHFLINLCKEVSLRLQCCGVQGRTFTLKIKKRRKDADEPAKFMGCGDCENLSHSVTIPLATENVEILQRIVKQLLGCFYIDVKEIRGIGLHVSRLENADTSKQEKYTLKSWLTSGSASVEKQKYHMGHNKHNSDCANCASSHGCIHSQGSSFQIDNKILNIHVSGDPISTPPPLCQLDVEVIRNLPSEVFSELNEIYGGKLIDFIAKGKGKCESSSSLGNSLEDDAATCKEEDLPYSDPIPLNQIFSENKAMQHERVLGSGHGSCSQVTHNSNIERDDLLPSSLSQIDASVLQQIPEDLKAVILEHLPAHRAQDFCSTPAICPGRINQDSVGVDTSKNCPGTVNHALNDSLWAGNLPSWMDKFKDSSCLRKLGEIYHRSGFNSQLSSVLPQFLSEFHHLDLTQEIYDETVNIMCELLKQYVKVKIERDIEEIYICFRLLKRFAVKSQFFSRVYNDIFPFLQAAVDDNYGGSLFMP
ncbi:DNA repair protein REV1 isoform X3 [Arachis ipaensis]|uniref:DNA repair protein REV1 isoform X3 n=1 Tax=Arachis ipaensis TaxID=130454 RepID=UPI000A2B38ED|nr:DNA repair protein REV1 isoform X3 [Arachis ipaensis]XP_025654180.1 DNA repair protein REV1 isoform X3 [Arachis hypogaea]